MSDISVFKSRTAQVNCTAEELYHFVSDIRNFKRFLPEDKFSDISIEKESCSFTVSMMGKVEVSVSEKREFSRVGFSGSAMQINEFSIVLDIRNGDNERSLADISVSAHLNPFLKMLAADPISRFLETLVAEMEKYNGWKDVSL